MIVVSVFMQYFNIMNVSLMRVLVAEITCKRQ